MSSTNDPIRLVRRRTRLTWLLGAAFWLPSLVWALRPLSIHSAPSPELTPRAVDVSSTPPVAFDVAPFSATLWVPIPVTAPARASAVPPAPVAPLKLQLIGIVVERATEVGTPPILRAALYDPDTDRLYVVTAGDTVGVHSVKEIGERSVTLTTPGRTSPSRLVLRESGRGGLP